MSEIKVSVLVAIYNAEQFLRQCLDSLRGQTLAECQFLCVDDCSTDSSVSIIKEYAAQDSRFQLLHTPVNSGHSVARNLGLSFARGEYITMLDADDWLSPDALSQSYAVATQGDGFDCVMFRLMMYNEWDHTQNPFPSLQFDAPISGQEAFRLSLDWQVHGYYILRREIHLQYPYDATFRVYTDDNITTRLHLLHSRSVAFSKGEYYYRQHADSITHKYSVNRFLFMDALSLLKENILREIAAGNIDNPESLLNHFENLRWFNYLDMVRYYLEHKQKMSATERADISRRLQDKLHSFETSRLESRLKFRPGYIPIQNWTLFLLQQRFFRVAYPLYRNLKN